MATYREQREVIDTIRVRDGTSRRIDCPFCGGTKTLTITRKNGSKVWNCYKASCDTKGGTGSEMTTESIRNKLAGKEDAGTATLVLIPEHLSLPNRHDKVISYLETNNSLEAYENGLVRVRFAPAENRVLFFTNENQGAIGRALDRRKPKWKEFGDTKGLFTVGTGNTAVLVEDAASACSVSRISELVGCAALGTSVNVALKRELLTYEELIIALDKDATQKAVALARKFEGRIRTRVTALEEDLKYLGREQVERVLT